MSKKIIAGKEYWFNNRSVTPLKKETEFMWFCIVNVGVTTDVTGSSWCHGCQVGHYHHDCEAYQECIDAIMENVEEYDVFWVHQNYLQEHPFEYKENEKLKKEIASQKATIETMQEAKYRLMADIESLNKCLSSTQKDIYLLEEIKKNAEAELQKVWNETGEAKSKFAKHVSIKNTKTTITAKEYMELIRSDVKLRMLENGGVDNWEWYGECVDSDKIENEVLERLL